MSAIINALFGGGAAAEGEITSDTNQTAVSSECLQTSAIAGDVQVKSVISSETQTTISSKLNIDALLTQLSTTYIQIDQYSQTKAAQINEQVQKSVAVLLENTRHLQEELLVDANDRHLSIDNEYKIQLQKAIEILDAVKAKALADLEHDLQGKQQVILNEAKKQIDLLNDQANVAKLNVLIEAQEQAKESIVNLANQVVAASQQEAENLLQSTTITIITSQAETAPTIDTPQGETAPTVVTPQVEAVPTIVTPQAETILTVITPQVETVPTVVTPQVEAVPTIVTPQVEPVLTIVTPQVETVPTIITPQAEVAPIIVIEAPAVIVPVEIISNCNAVEAENQPLAPPPSDNTIF